MTIGIEIIVVASRRRKPVVTKYLTGLPHSVSWTPDYPFPEDWKISPEYEGLNKPENVIFDYRCFRGHQDAIRQSKEEVTLIFEDDARPIRWDWISLVQGARSLSGKYEIVSLHATSFDRAHFTPVPCKGVGEFLLPKDRWKAPHAKVSMFWALRSVAYLINRAGKEKFLSQSYEGLPVDLFIANRFAFCVISESPFEHDLRYGSLIR